MKKYVLFIGVDMSKSFFDISVLRAKSTKRLYHKRYLNNEQGIKEMIKELEEQANTKSTAWLLCMEHTGVYTLPLASYLSKHDIDYALLPAIEIQKSMGIKRGKNDQSDSLEIARYASKNHEEISTYQLPEKSLMKLKLLLGLRDRLISSRTIFKNSGKEIGAFTDKQVSKEVRAESKSMIALLDKRVAKVEKQVKTLVDSDESMKEVFSLITSVPGIGPQIAYHLIVVTRCFTAFTSARKLSCYAGVAPFEHSSGSSIRGKTRVSHLADKKLKSLLGMGAVAASRFDKELNHYYLRKVDEGKHKMSVMNAIKNKLIGRVFATVKRGTPYVPLMNYSN